MTQNPMEITGGMKVPTATMRRSSANRGVWVIGFLSLFVHGGIIGGVVYAQSREPTRKIVTSIPVELVRLGKPRDPKLLPRKAGRAPPPPDDGVNLDTGKASKPTKPSKRKKKSDAKMSDAARRLLAGADSQLDDAFSKIDEEPEGQLDGDPLGTAARATNAANAYQAAVFRTMRAKYKLPETIPASQRRFLSAEVVLYIERDGRISKFEFTKAHPNKLFMAALDSMLKSTRLPAPPKALAAEYRSTGLGVRFKP